MANFSVGIPSFVEIPDLIQRVVAATLNSDEIEMLRRLFDAGRAYGAIVRDRSDDDAPTIGRIYRLEYEQFVDFNVPLSFQTANKQLAYDLTAVAFREGHRCHTEKPESLKPLIELLAA